MKVLRVEFVMLSIDKLFHKVSGAMRLQAGIVPGAIRKIASPQIVGLQVARKASQWQAILTPVGASHLPGLLLPFMCTP